MTKTAFRRIRITAINESHLTTREKEKETTPQEQYTDVSDFDSTDEVIFPNKSNYKVAMTILLNSSPTCPVNIVFDTCTGPSLLREDID